MPPPPQRCHWGRFGCFRPGRAKGRSRASGYRWCPAGRRGAASIKLGHRPRQGGGSHLPFRLTGFDSWDDVTGFWLVGPKARCSALPCAQSTDGRAIFLRRSGGHILCDWHSIQSVYASAGTPALERQARGGVGRRVWCGYSPRSPACSSSWNQRLTRAGRGMAGDTAA